MKDFIIHIVKKTQKICSNNYGMRYMEYLIVAFLSITLGALWFTSMNDTMGSILESEAMDNVDETLNYTISVNDYSKPYDTTDVTLDVIDKSASISGTWSFTDTNISVVNVEDSGAYYLTFTPSESNFYSEKNIKIAIDVTPAPITVTAENKEMIVGASLPELTYTASGFFNEDTFIKEPTLTSATTGKTTGEFDIIPSIAQVGENYSCIYINGTLTVSDKSTQTISINPIGIQEYAEGKTFELSTSGYSGTGAITYVSSDPSIISIIGSTAYIHELGTVDITVFINGDNAYKDASDSQDVTVVKGVPQITFAAIGEKTYGDSDFTLTSSVFPKVDFVTYSSSDASVISVNGATATVVAPGSATITVTTPETDYYQSASASQVVVVNKITPSISFATVSEKTYGDAAFTLSATTSSTSAVTFTSGNTSYISISGSTATIKGAGTVTLTATVAENTYYKGASISQTVVVAKASRTLAFTSIGSLSMNATATLNATASAGTGTITYNSGNTSVVSISGTTATAKGIGSAVLTATIAADSNYLSVSATQTVTVSLASNILYQTGTINTSVISGFSTWVYGDTTSSNTAATFNSGNIYMRVYQQKATSTGNNSGSSTRLGLDTSTFYLSGYSTVTIKFTGFKWSGSSGKGTLMLQLCDSSGTSVKSTSITTTGTSSTTSLSTSISGYSGYYKIRVLLYAEDKSFSSSCNSYIYITNMYLS